MLGCWALTLECPTVDNKNRSGTIAGQKVTLTSNEVVNVELKTHARTPAAFPNVKKNANIKILE